MVVILRTVVIYFHYLLELRKLMEKESGGRAIPDVLNLALSVRHNLVNFRKLIKMRLLLKVEKHFQRFVVV